MTSDALGPDPVTCDICGCLVARTELPRHEDWHERLVDEVVSAVKVRLADPPREG